MSQALMLITGAVFVLSLIILALAFVSFRRSRRDVFWRRRREAGQRGLRLLFAAGSLLLVSAVMCSASLLWPLLGGNDDDGGTDIAIVNPDGEGQVTLTQRALATISVTPDPSARPVLKLSLTPTAGPSPTSTPQTTRVDEQPPATLTQTAPASAQIASETPQPTFTPIIVSATPLATTTETPFPTFTPQENAPLMSSITPRPEASLRITALDDEISDSFTPVEPRTVFPAGTQRVYLFVEFDGMQPGILWKRHLYRGTELVEGDDYLWGRETTGTGYFFFGSSTGFEPGDYEIRLYLGDQPDPVSVARFTIAG